MGLLDSLIGALGNSGAGAAAAPATGGVSPDLLQALLGLLANDGQGGSGLVDLIARFQRGGLGDVIGSWIAHGPNQPVNGDQLGGVLGQDTVGALAQQLGLSHGDVLGQIAQVLPGLVDHLTPQGQVPQGGLGGLGDILAQLSRR